MPTFREFRLYVLNDRGSGSLQRHVRHWESALAEAISADMTGRTGSYRYFRPG